MALTETSQRGVAAAVCVLVLIASTWAVTGYVRRAAAAETPPNQPGSGRIEPPRTADSDQPVVKLTPSQQAQVGLETAALEAAPHPEQFRAYGAVLDISRITELTNSYTNAQAQLQTAQAKLEVARSAYDRTRISSTPPPSRRRKPRPQREHCGSTRLR